ncbi:MAG: class I tRNA ligase family protein, partial [Halobacteria archaeon]|nr:class I tRNA ligase family protein [Halobacteria archaeon]
MVVLFSKEVSDQYNPDDVESEVRDYWEYSNAYRRAKETHKDEENFYFLDGPPYTNGQIHVGHAWNKTLKDAMMRYKRMQGHNVADRPGYDMHGLPVEVKVEQELGFGTKKDIEEYGVDNFVERCEEFAERNREKMDEDFKSFGVWMDWDNPYKTLSNDYMETAWWAFKQAYDRGLVERGKRVVNQCPRCVTPVANAEVEYDEVKSPSAYVKFPLVEGGGGDKEYLVVWTTTPWTIPANLFVAVDSELEYEKVRAYKEDESGRGRESEVLYVASDCVEDVLREGRYKDYETLETLRGSELEGLRYKHPLSEEVPKQ